MLKLELPVFDCKIKQKDGKLFIYDILRKKFVVLQPEEWVRQHVVHYLINHLNISPLYIKLEQGNKYLERQKRSDILVWNQAMKVALLVECKAPQVGISKETAFQISVYNKDLNASFLWITNGMVHYYFKKTTEGYEEIGALPINLQD